MVQLQPHLFYPPVYLEPGIEYCNGYRSASARYKVFISRVGENDLINSVFVSNQPYLGSLYKSQNGSVWEPSQWEDLKFTLYRASNLLKMVHLKFTVLNLILAISK